MITSIITSGGRRLFLSMALLGMMAASSPNSAPAQTTSSNVVAIPLSDADKAWKETEKALRSPMPPAEWQMQRPTPEQIQEYRVHMGQMAGDAADKAKDFYTRYPDHPKAAEARKKEYELLQTAVRLGNTNKAAALEAKEAERLKDPSLSEDDRAQLRMQAVQRAVMAKQLDGETAMMTELESQARAYIKEFPKREEGYQMLLEVAGSREGDQARELAKEIIASTQSEDAKKAAEGLLRKLDALGKPVDIEFKAVDGRDVSISKLKGKVVLIDFWATWCGPCVGEIPHVKEAYDKLHEKGFEIVGISFDGSQDALEKFVTDKEMAWPQYFDGKRWQNKFGQEFGINSIPAMWLVDKKGNLRDMNARGALEEKVEKLLAE